MKTKSTTDLIKDEFDNIIMADIKEKTLRSIVNIL